MNKRYIFPEWFDNIDNEYIHKLLPKKNGKIIISSFQYQKLLNNVCNSTKFISLEILDNYTVSDILYKRFICLHKLLVSMSTHKKGMVDNREEIMEILQVRVCDYDWYFVKNNIPYDKESTHFLISKI